MYGDAEISRAHPVVAFLAKDKHAKSVSLFKPGCAAASVSAGLARCAATPDLVVCSRRFDALDTAFPFLCTPSTKANSGKK